MRLLSLSQLARVVAPDAADPVRAGRAWAERFGRAGLVESYQVIARAPKPAETIAEFVENDATLEALRSEGLVARSLEVGARAQETLRGELAGLPSVVDVRGVGLMIGIELESPALALRASRGMLERGYIVITGGTRGEVLTLTPPLTIPEPLLHGAARALREALSG